MLHVSYTERKLLGGDPPRLFLKLNLYICITPGRFSPTPSCNSGDRRNKLKDVEGQ